MPKARVLVVEDEPNIATSLNYILSRADFAVDTVADGGEALGRLRRERFGAVVLDVMLPGMSGFEVLRAIRADSRTVDLPVIVLTAKG